MGKDGWSLAVDPTDPHVVRFSYPRGMQGHLDYVMPQVVLELGTHAEFIPRGPFKIRSFAAMQFPALFDDPDIHLTALPAKRTFWEKVTILHAEYYRPRDKPLPEKYSRHYYDVAMLANGPIKMQALAERELLAQVVCHKVTFYASARARYDLAVPGTLRLAPPEYRVAALRRDYQGMAVMIFGEPPDFDAILQT